MYQNGVTLDLLTFAFITLCLRQDRFKHQLRDFNETSIYQYSIIPPGVAFALEESI